MSKKLPKRHEVPEELTWNLQALFASDEDYEKAMAEAKKAAEDFAETYEGKLKTAEDASFVLAAVKAYERLSVKLSRLSLYSNLAHSADMGDPELRQREAENTQFMAAVSAKISFYRSELSEVKDELLEEAAKEAPGYKIYLGDLREKKKHLLSPETEAVLAALEPALSLPYEMYGTLKMADMKFPDFEAKGEMHPLSYVAYEGHYCEERDTEIRRKAFAAFSETLGRYRHSTAAAYNAQVQREKTEAGLRGFDSVFDYLLSEQKVTREMYDRQIDVIMTELAPVMQRYAKLLQKAYGLEEMHYADLKLVLDPDFAPQVSVEESKQYVADAVAIMGDAYKKRVMQSYEERWVDFAQNEGKSTGGFCAVIPEAQPYILLNWSGSLSEVYTLIHELGHAMQGLLCYEHNTVLQGDFTRYDIEAPSTFHEMLLTESLLRQNKGPRFERWVLSSMIGNTYYHNYVTHLLEAAYQREVYRLVDKGQNLQADTLDALYRGVLEKFWGDAVILDEGAERTWMRQPHYYMGLYSYVYSASLTIATAMAMRLKEEGEKAVPDWIKFLSTGGPLPPAEHAAMVGIDITTDKPLKDSIRYVDRMLRRVEELTEELASCK